MSDAIDRQMAIDYLITKANRIGAYGYLSAKEIHDYLKGLPSAEPERKKGKWISHEGGKFVGFPYMHYECSECRVFEPTETNFCPNCGVDMRGEEDE